MENVFNIFIGGHYNFPNLPSFFAEKSMRYVVGLKENIKSSQEALLVSFINDIRFSNFCSIGACEIDFQTKSKKQIKKINLSTIDTIESNEIVNYDRNYSFLLSNKITDQMLHILQNGTLNQFSNYVIDQVVPNAQIQNNNSAGLKISALYYIVKASKMYLSKAYYNDLIFAIDYFVYCFDKNSFTPFNFKSINKNIDIVWEKSIYNYASKVIRKLDKKQEHKGLCIENIDDGVRLFSCKSFEGSKIILRREETKGYFNAINKCPLIIATLYYKLVLSNMKKSNKINISYVIPSYDRNRVNLGTEAFFNVYYPVLKEMKHNLTVNIDNIYWIEPNSKINIVDSYSNNLKSISIYEQSNSKRI